MRTGVTVFNEDSIMKVTILKVAVAHTALAAALVALPVIDSVARSTPKARRLGGLPAWI